MRCALLRTETNDVRKTSWCVEGSSNGGLRDATATEQGQDMTVAVAADAAGDVKVIDVATPVLEQLRAFHAALRSGGAANASGDAAAAVSAARRLAWQSESQSRGYIMDRRATKSYLSFFCV